MSERLESALKEARNKLEVQRELLNRLVNPPLEIGHVIEVTATRRVKVAKGSEIVELFHPDFTIKPGDEVSVANTGQIVKKTDFSAIGPVAMVRRVIDEHFCEIEISGQARLIRTHIKVEIGDEVLTDTTSSVAIAKLSDAKEQQFEYFGQTGVTWESIGGLEDAKLALREAVEMPFLYPDLFKWYGKKPIKGVELYGPPGCGKTMLAKALVTSLSKDDKVSGFFYIKGPEILDPFVGVAEANLRRVFAKSRLHKKKTGMPGVVFIDEADAILSKRGSSISSDMEKTIVPTFLAEVDGLDDASSIVILATNRADRLDPAVIRPGRIDRKVHVRRPNEDESANIFEIYLKSVPLNNGSTTKQLARKAARGLFEDSRTIYRITRKGGDCVNFTLGHLASGAMIANVVDHAVSECLHADIRSRRTRTGTGITQESLDRALDRSLVEIADDNHDDDLKAFVATDRDRVVSIDKVRITV